MAVEIGVILSIVIGLILFVYWPTKEPEPAFDIQAKYPKLGILGTYLHGYDYVEESELLPNVIGPEQHFERIPEEARRLSEEPDLPWQALGHKVNRVFKNADDAREWLRKIAVLVEAELGYWQDVRVYALKEADIEAAREKLETALGIRFLDCKSLASRGHYYIYTREQSGKLILKGHDVTLFEAGTDFDLVESPFADFTLIVVGAQLIERLKTMPESADWVEILEYFPDEDYID